MTINSKKKKIKMVATNDHCKIILVLWHTTIDLMLIYMFL